MSSSGSKSSIKLIFLRRGFKKAQFLWPAQGAKLTAILPGVIYRSHGVHVSSVIRQKGESQNGCFKKAKHAKISKKQTFLTP